MRSGRDCEKSAIFSLSSFRRKINGEQFARRQGSYRQYCSHGYVTRVQRFRYTNVTDLMNGKSLTASMIFSSVNVVAEVQH